MAKKAQSEEAMMQEAVSGVLQILGIDGTVTIERKEDEVSVLLDTPDSGLVIGYHGEMLEALQLVLSLVLSKKLGSFLRVVVEIGDYRKNRTEWLEQLVARSKEKAVERQEDVTLTNLKAWERRIVHMMLQEDEEVVTESVGEGNERVLVIKPKQQEA